MARSQKIFKTCLLLSFLLTYFSCGNNYKYDFKYALPETKGFSSDKLEILEKHIKKSGSSALMIMVDGDIVFEWGETDKKHTIHSIRKALLNSLYGIAIDKGQIDTSMTLRELKIDDIGPDLSENELHQFTIFYIRR